MIWKRACLVSAVFLFTGLFSQSLVEASPRIERLAPNSNGASAAILETRGAFIALSIPDVAASAAWYSEKLGLQITLQPPKANQSTVIVLEGGGLIVELLQHDQAVPLSQACPSITSNYLVHGIYKAGVIVKHFDKLVDALEERDVQIVIGPFPETEEQRANLIIRDNAGNLIQFFGE